jgi:hypothetical protein
MDAAPSEPQIASFHGDRHLGKMEEGSLQSLSKAKVGNNHEQGSVANSINPAACLPQQNAETTPNVKGGNPPLEEQQSGIQGNLRGESSTVFQREQQASSSSEVPAEPLAAQAMPAAGTPGAAQPTPTPGRPMTAKKAPPKAPGTKGASLSRSRLRPPEAALRHTGSKARVLVYTEDPGADCDDVDIVQETYVCCEDQEQAHGALVSDMYKTKEAADQMAQDSGNRASNVIELEGGINLGRSQRKRKCGTARADLGQMRDAVEALVQGITPLARSMEYLQVGFAVSSLLHVRVT